MAHFCDEKNHLSANITEIHSSFHAISLHPCRGSAKKQTYGTLMAFIMTLQYKRRLYDVRNTGVYDADPWKEPKCNKLVVSVSGSSLQHPLCLLHCYTLLTNSKQSDVLPGCWLCHPLHATGCQITA